MNNILIHIFTTLQFKDDTMTFYFLSFLQILLVFLFQKAIEHHLQSCFSCTEVVQFTSANDKLVVWVGGFDSCNCPMKGIVT